MLSRLRQKISRKMTERLVLCSLLGVLAAGLQTEVEATCPLDGKNCTDPCNLISSGCECNQVDCEAGTCIYSGCSTYCCQETCNGGPCGA